MRVGLIAKKIGMSRFYDSAGLNHPVTILEVDNCKVIETKTYEKHGYKSVRLSLGSAKKLNKPLKGFSKKNNLGSFKISKEFVVSEPEQYKVGSSLSVNNFVEGQFVDVSANSIGKGFAGGMKRHNFAGNRATHGVSISHRSHGSTGQCQDPGKVFKGKKMAGRLGNKKVTIQNLKVLKVDLDNNILLVRGAVPGHKGSVISIFDSVKKKQDIKVDNENIKTDNTENNSQDVQNDKNQNTSALNETSTEIKASEQPQNSSVETKKVGDDKAETDKVTDEKTDKKDID